MVSHEPNKTCVYCGSTDVHEQYICCADCHANLKPNEEYERNVIRDVRHRFRAHGTHMLPHLPKYMTLDMKRVKLRRADDYTRDEKTEGITFENHRYHGDNVSDDCY